MSKKKVENKIKKVEQKIVSKPKVRQSEKVTKEKVVKKTIFDKYRKHINSAKDGYVNGLSYSQAMEILRYIESKRNIKLGLNVNCGGCMIDLVLMFARLEDK